MSFQNDRSRQIIKKKIYEKPEIKSSTIKDTFLACGKCGTGPIEQFLCVIYPELS